MWSDVIDCWGWTLLFIRGSRNSRTSMGKMLLTLRGTVLKILAKYLQYCCKQARGGSNWSTLVYISWHCNLLAKTVPFLTSFSINYSITACIMSSIKLQNLIHFFLFSCAIPLDHNDGRMTRPVDRESPDRIKSSRGTRRKKTILYYSWKTHRAP